MLDYLIATQGIIASGSSSPKEQAGPPYPNFNVVLNPNTKHTPHLLSKVFTDILQTFPDLYQLPIQVAVVHMMFLLMRWQVDPTKENYERMPEWFRPRPEQLFCSHPHWMDYIPWPLLRAACIQKKPFVEFDTFFVPFTMSLSLNWPYSPETVLTPPATSTPAESEEPFYSINPAFEVHLLNLRNWSLGPEFRDTFPEWGNCVQIKGGQ
jgi:hypothetical protein